ncbi:MAG: cold shock domain-containing protein [Elusimicrobia bacterium]|nr:cold shock domain-containing protein [Elusimicrobiota bacterium]
MKKLLSSFIAAALILTAPGLSAYAAAGAVISQGSVKSVPVGLQGPARGVAPISGFSNSAFGLSSPGLKGVLSPQSAAPSPVVQGLAAPLAAPSVKVGESESLPLPGPVLDEIGAAVPAAEQPAAEAKLDGLLGEKEKLSITPDQLGSMSDGTAKTSAASIMDRILGIRQAETSDDAVAADPAVTPALRGAVEKDLAPLLSAAGFLSYRIEPGIPSHQMSYMREPHVLVRMGHPEDLLRQKAVLYRAAGMPVVYDFASNEGVATMSVVLEKAPSAEAKVRTPDSVKAPAVQAEPAWKTQQKRQFVTALGSLAGIAAGLGVKALIPAFAVAPVVGWFAGAVAAAYFSARILRAVEPNQGRILGALTTIGRVALAGGAVFGLQALAVTFAPAIFGLVPVAAVWAVSSGALLLPVALYARYRLSLRDSPRLTKVKWVLDLSIGAFLGAVAIAAPSFAAIVSLEQLAAAGLPLAGLVAGRTLGGGSSFLDGLATWGSLAVLPAFLGAAAAGIIGIGPMLGMMMLPVMTTLAFFLGRIIFSAETGRPFSVPGSLQKLRFPSFQWVMTGVVFALLTGFSAVYSNYAFFAWQFLGSKSWGWDKGAPLWKNLVYNVLNFNTLYLGLFAFTAATAFTSPLTFLVIAFAAERAANWTEVLLGKLLPKAAPAPSTTVKPLADPDTGSDKPGRWPKYRYWLKTGLLIGSMAVMGFGMGMTVFGLVSLGKNLAIAAVLAGIPFFFATKIIKLIMKTKPADEVQDAEFFSVIRELRERINARRAAKGQKPIPMPELVNDPLEAPNAYATGRSPFHALVGLTKVLREMTFVPENVRSGVIRLLAASDPDSKAFKVFRKAIRGSIPGVAADAGPVPVAEAVRAADPADLKKLGTRALRGVMAHELSHVMDRHMLLGSIAGAISSGVAFAAYGVMWAVGHAQAAARKLKEFFFPPKQKPEDLLKGDTRVGLEPISTAVTAKSLPALLRVFAALWAPIVLQLTQMASSRSNEGMADEDGAKLSEDPEALALALGLLTTWRPAAGYRLPARRLPLVSANAHLYTVNPIEQLHRADALPKSDPLSEMVVGKQDDFLFNLFITHPDTNQRIERLYEMSEAKDAGVLGSFAPPAAPKAGLSGTAGWLDVATTRGKVAYGSALAGLLGLVAFAGLGILTPIALALTVAVIGGAGLGALALLASRSRRSAVPALAPLRSGVIERDLEKVLRPGGSYEVFVQLRVGAGVTETDQFVYYVSQAARSWERSLTGFRVLGLPEQDVRVVAGFSAVSSVGLSYAPRVGGQVKWFNDARGYGFIAADDGEDVFVRAGAIERSGYQTLIEGERVELEVVQNEKGERSARRVIPLR